MLCLLDEPAPPLHRLVRTSVLVFELLVLLFCMLYGAIHATPLQKAALMLVAFFISPLTFSLHGTRFAPGNPFLFFRRYNPSNLFHYA